jgi:hypothetical protein
MRTSGSAVSVNEFVRAIAEFAALPSRAQTDLIAYYLIVVLGRASVQAADLAAMRLDLQLAPHKSLATHLSNGTRRSKNKPAKYVRAQKGYLLERAYQTELAAQYLGRPTAQAVARDLRAELAKITDPDITAYLTEAVSCFEYGLFRAAIVLTWCVAYSRLRDWLHQMHLAAFNAQAATWKTPVTIQWVDDFQELNEGTVVETARKAGVLTKELHKTLKQLLDQRNSYAHPSHKPIRPSIAEAYIETTIHEVLRKLK